MFILNQITEVDVVFLLRWSWYYDTVAPSLVCVL